MEDLPNSLNPIFWEFSQKILQKKINYFFSLITRWWTESPISIRKWWTCWLKTGSWFIESRCCRWISKTLKSSSEIEGWFTFWLLFLCIQIGCKITESIWIGIVFKLWAFRRSFIKSWKRIEIVGLESEILRLRWIL